MTMATATATATATAATQMDQRMNELLLVYFYPVLYDDA
jgi:hypothetical protein